MNTICNADTKKLINDIQLNKLSSKELARCLKHEYMYVVSNAIIMITKLGLCDDEILNAIIPILSCKHEFFNQMSLGNLALASLKLMRNNERAIHIFNDRYKMLNLNNRVKVDKLVEFLKNEKNLLIK